MGKISINGPFSMAMLSNQRVTIVLMCYNAWHCLTLLGGFQFSVPLFANISRWSQQRKSFLSHVMQNPTEGALSTSGSLDGENFLQEAV